MKYSVYFCYPYKKWKQEGENLCVYHYYFLIILILLTSSTKPLNGSISSTFYTLKSISDNISLKWTGNESFLSEYSKFNGLGYTPENNKNDTHSITTRSENNGNSLLYRKIFPRLDAHQFLEMTISLMDRNNSILKVNNEISKLLRLYNQDIDLSTMIRSSNGLNLNPKKTLIVSYKNFCPSRMMETLLERTKLFKNIWQSLKLDFPMNSIYLRNLGMEIIEVPEKFHIQSFKEILKRQSSIIHSIFEDYILDDPTTDFYINNDETLESFYNISNHKQLYNSMNNEVYNSPNNDLYNSPNNELYNSPNNELYNSINNEVYNSPNNELYNSPNNELYNSPNNELYNSINNELYNPPNNELYYSPNNEPCNTFNNEPYNTANEEFDMDKPSNSQSYNETWDEEKTKKFRVLRSHMSPNDSGFNKQWAFIDSGDSKWGVEIEDAWQFSSKNNPDKFTVALIDSGVDYNHPDLNRSLWKNPGEICNNGIDDDENGYIDDCYGWDFVNNDNNPMDDNGHGTASAGILAAQTNNGIGVAGMCWNCKLMLLKALNHQIKGSVSGFIRALDYSLEKGAVLSSNSYGGRGSNFNGLEEAVKRAQKQGMIFVAAAGNYKGNNDNDRNPVFPASYQMDNVISVAAITRSGRLANFSSYGKRSVDIAAPGEKVFSTFLGTGYKYVDGTSFAVPFVTGAVALIWSKYPHLEYTQVISRVLDNQKPCPFLQGLTKSEGVLDVARAFGYKNMGTELSILSENSCYETNDCGTEGFVCEKKNGLCTCKNGYELDGILCKDIDECKYNPCGEVSTCYNKVGSFECKCNSGFKRVDNNCEDYNECEEPGNCPQEAKCYNFAGTFECLCPEGNQWISLNETYNKCVPNQTFSRNQCLENGGCPPNSICKVHRSFWFSTIKCECLPGYYKDIETENCIREGIMPFQKQEYLNLLKSRSTINLNNSQNKGVCFLGICF